MRRESAPVVVHFMRQGQVLSLRPYVSEETFYFMLTHTFSDKHLQQMREHQEARITHHVINQIPKGTYFDT